MPCPPCPAYHALPCPAHHAPAAFRYSSHLTPRRLLTKPAEPAGNSGWDNATHDLIVAVGDEFVSTLGSRWGRWPRAGAGVGCTNSRQRSALAFQVWQQLWQQLWQQPDPGAELS
jgi:hypothetical protein